MKSVNSICEIGAGFGRTCHGILNNFENILQYTIVDLPGCLTISKKYLKKVLSKKNFRKINFMDYRDADRVNNTDLFINVDSFAEMDKYVINNYLSLISKKAKFLYVKNPVGKYTPDMVDVYDYNKDDFRNALKTGLCKNIINVFNNEEINKATKPYLRNYCPGSKFKLIKAEPSLPFAYYCHALYKKK